MRSGWIVAAALLLSGCIIGDFGQSDRYQADFHYSWDLKPGGRVNVEGFNGSIEVTGWDQDKVDVNGTKFGSTEELRDSIRIDTHNTPDSIDIRAVRPSVGTGGHMGGMGTRYTVRVPRKAVLDRITTSNGSIRVHDVAAAEHLKSSNGTIRLENVDGDVEAHTSNSSIELDSVGGAARLRTSNGHIRAENVKGTCDAQTSNSSISVRTEDATDSPVRLVSSNGSITLTLTKPPKGNIRAQTSNSSITLHLPANSSGRLTADTSNSSISSDFDVLTTTHDDRRKKHLEGVIGNGGPSIDLLTSNGHIQILKANAD